VPSGWTTQACAELPLAQALFVSPNTIANHVSNILGKTGSANRTEVAAFAMRHLPVSG
jgi:DNA-binding NarL/FixJ family response regulator